MVTLSRRDFDVVVARDDTALGGLGAGFALKLPELALDLVDRLCSEELAEKGHDARLLACPVRSVDQQVREVPGDGQFL